MSLYSGENNRIKTNGFIIFKTLMIQTNGCCLSKYNVQDLLNFGTLKGKNIYFCYVSEQMSFYKYFQFILCIFCIYERSLFLKMVYVAYSKSTFDDNFRGRIDIFLAMIQISLLSLLICCSIMRQLPNKLTRTIANHENRSLYNCLPPQLLTRLQHHDNSSCI